MITARSVRGEAGSAGENGQEEGGGGEGRRTLVAGVGLDAGLGGVGEHAAAEAEDDLRADDRVVARLAAAEADQEAERDHEQDDAEDDAVSGTR